MIVKPEYLKDHIFKLVMTNGCFDFGLTAAHILSLKYARSFGEQLVVALNDDDSVRRLKGDNRPIVPLHERMMIVDAIRYVDYVVSFTEDTPVEIIKIIMPDLLCKGGDLTEQQIPGYGIVPIIVHPFYKDMVSTSDKIKMALCR